MNNSMILKMCNTGNILETELDKGRFIEKYHDV